MKTQSSLERELKNRGQQPRHLTLEPKTRPESSENKSANTPWPWNVGGMGVVIDARMNAIALPGPGKLAVEQDANARLIAAAPELLTSLKMIMSWVDAGCDPSKKSLHASREAIAKAEGRE